MNNKSDNGQFCGIHANALVVFADGRRVTIREVVEQKIQGEVWTYNEKSEQFEAQEITGWYYNGFVESTDDYVYIETSGIDYQSRGRFGFAITPKCQLKTINGWKDADQLEIGDQLLTKYNSIINGTVEDFLWGTLIAASSIKSSSANTSYVVFQSDLKQEYVQWKVDKLSVAFDFHKGYRGGYESNGCYELKAIENIMKSRDPSLMLREHYSDMGMAVWYMDHGRLDINKRKRAIISLKRLKGDREKLDEIAHLLKTNGVPCTSYSYDYGTFTFTKENLTNLFDKICRFVPPCMQHKLLEEHRGKYDDFELSNDDLIKECYTPILQLRAISNRQLNQAGKYLISTQNGNYLIGGETNGVVISDKSKYIDKFNNERCNQQIELQFGGICKEEYVKFVVNNINGKRINGKGGTIERLYNRFYDQCRDRAGMKLNRENIAFSTPIVNNDGYIEQRLVSDVIKNGTKTCLKITTSLGYTIVVAEDQKLINQHKECVSASDLLVGDAVLIHNNTCFTKEHNRKKYPETTVRYHPYGIRKILEGKYEYYRVRRSHIVYEAYLNNMSESDYINYLNTSNRKDISNLIFIDKSQYDIHHKDFNPENNTIENLQMMLKSEHYKMHATMNQDKLSFVAIEDKIETIEVVGECDVYKIKCESSANCVVGNFVVEC